MKMKMQMIQFVSTVNWIQMKLMKVIDKMKNMAIQEFEHSLESIWIQVMKMKMHTIQLVSTVNLIQMKLMKVFHKMKNSLIQEFQHVWNQD
jgi:hypothetical protein